MGIIKKQITLNDIDILREPLDKLHEHHNSQSKYFSGDYPRITFEERIEEYKKISRGGEFRIELLIESRGLSIIGFCISYRKNKNGKIDVLFIDEKYQRNGLGIKLMNSAIEWFKKMNINEIELLVVYGNEVDSFYQKFGFNPRSIIMTAKL
ncbi:GNAT family N-acetyltransferase [Bacillus cereus]|uniref:GNAT family N-acetyltransferase n=1 Tax=Bacillus cereus group sp. MYBK5-2 TaxID=3450622 RepID=UPI002DB5E156|nr:GNAT family N-acetyltransferase [Bacillus cereus]